MTTNYTPEQKAELDRLDAALRAENETEMSLRLNLTTANLRLKAMIRNMRKFSPSEIRTAQEHKHRLGVQLTDCLNRQDSIMSKVEDIVTSVTLS